MESVEKKIVHGLPPIPSRSSSNRRNGRASKAPGGSETEKTTENQVDHEQEAKKLKRILASRQYSQKYRLKQLHYILHLETEVNALQAEVAISSPRIKYVNRQNSLLRAENGSMKQKVSAFTGELTFKEAQYEELKRERQILKHLYTLCQQQEQPEFVIKIGPDQKYQL
ncbi:putative Basic-leucine zipper transcription factor family protein [Melia azedarach]|uniref:Basic-leucine zipper transcription factor family protein n=1 Tax=Melia azedarach TaxID=155640 RepID=A0ACC1YQS9_MELAZ|nr:putative Basic-leucine zipper transcription factor family protein [Melia azedarach]